MPRAYKERREYGPDDKLKAAVIYVTTGSQMKAAESIGTDRQVINAWVHKGDPIWVEMVEKAQENYDKELPGKLSGLIEKAIDRIGEALPNSTANQAATVLGICFDKRQIIQNKPTSISGRKEEIDKELEATAKRLINASNRRRDIKPVPIASSG
jgi:hypothetical protein